MYYYYTFYDNILIYIFLTWFCNGNVIKINEIIIYIEYICTIKIFINQDNNDDCNWYICIIYTTIIKIFPFVALYHFPYEPHCMIMRHSL